MNLKKNKIGILPRHRTAQKKRKLYGVSSEIAKKCNIIERTPSGKVSLSSPRGKYKIDFIISSLHTWGGWTWAGRRAAQPSSLLSPLIIISSMSPPLSFRHNYFLSKLHLTEKAQHLFLEKQIDNLKFGVLFKGFYLIKCNKAFKSA